MHDIGIVLEALLMKSAVKCVQQDLQIVIDVDRVCFNYFHKYSLTQLYLCRPPRCSVKVLQDTADQ